MMSLFHIFSLFAIITLSTNEYANTVKMFHVFTKNITLQDLQGEWTANFMDQDSSFTVTGTVIRDEKSGNINEIKETDDEFMISDLVLKKQSERLRWKSKNANEDMLWYVGSIDNSKDAREQAKEGIFVQKEKKEVLNEKVIWEGWIKNCWSVQKESGLLEKFGKSWFVLHNNGNFKYYTDKNKNLKKGQANITEGFKGLSFKGDGSDFSAITFKTSKIDWHFKFKTDQDATVWIEFCEQIKKESVTDQRHTIDDLQGEWATNCPGVSFTVTDTQAKVILGNDSERVCEILETDETFIITGDNTNWYLKKKSSTLRWESTDSETDLLWYKPIYKKVIWKGWIEAGWIKKEESRSLKTFQKQWFVLHNNGNFEYYNDQKKNSKKEGQANITEGFQGFSFRGDGAKFNEVIVQTSKTDWYGKFETDQDALVWIEFCEQIKKEGNIKENKFPVSDETKDIVSPKQSADEDQIPVETNIIKEERKKKAMVYMRNFSNTLMKNAKQILCNKKKKHLKEQLSLPNRI